MSWGNTLRICGLLIPFFVFTSLITISKFSIIIYLETFLLSLGSALLLERIEVFLVKYLKKLR